MKEIICIFVPQRTADCPWENDNVVFRDYGRTAQNLIEEDVSINSKRNKNEQRRYIE